MPKTKFKFNPETLAYEKVQITFKRRLYKFFRTFIALSFTAGIILTVMFYFFDTPKEKMLQRENNFLVTQFKFANKKLENLHALIKELQERDDNIYRIIFEAEPIPSTVRNAGMGGINRYQEYEGYSNSKLVAETAQLLDNTLKQIYIQSKSYDNLIEMAKNKTRFFSSVPAIQPIANRDVVRFASGFGYRIHPIYKTPKMHEGVDITAPTGTLVRATGDGVVVESQLSSGGFGKVVIIDHGFGYHTVYAHLSKCLIKKGKPVKRGEVIGMVGNTGRSTAPHLHYEVRKSNKPVDPINYYFNDLTPEEYDQMVQVSSQINQSFD